MKLSILQGITKSRCSTRTVLGEAIDQNQHKKGESSTKPAQELTFQHKQTSIRENSNASSDSRTNFDTLDAKTTVQSN